MATKQPEGTLVTMSDSRKVMFGKRQKLSKEVLFRDGSAYAVRFDFRNSATETLQLDRVPSTTQAHLTAHGASQKCGDECADLDSVDDMLEAVRDMIERLTAGNWQAERQAFAGQSILIEAIMEVSGQARDKVRDILKAMPAKEKAALKTEPSVKRVYDRIESERAKDVDTSGLLAKFAS